MKLPRFIRLLIAYGLGDDDRQVPTAPEGLPPDIGPIVANNMSLLTEYQNAEYARLYVNRLRRFVNRKAVNDRMLREIACLLALRMAYEDLIWSAQQMLAGSIDGDVSGSASLPLRGGADHNVVTLTLKDILSMFPAKVAGPVIDALAFFGWKDPPVKISLTASTWQGRFAARIIASLRRLRPRSARYAQEKSLVERWLHMIERALTKQPSAVWETIETATLLCGLGDSYKHSVANWHLMIDELAKPTFDGQLPLVNLGESLGRVRGIAAADPSGELVRKEIAKIRAGLAHAV